MRRHIHVHRLRLPGVALLATLTGCGHFTPPEQGGRSQDLLAVARRAVDCLRRRDYHGLYPLTSSAYRRGRSFEEFLERNRAAETPTRLSACTLDQDSSVFEENRALLVFDTSLEAPGPAGTEALPRRLLATFVRERRGWRLHDVLTLPMEGPLPFGASPSSPARGS